MQTTKIPYWQKLRDPRWQKLRLEVMQRAEFKCQDCGSADKNLQVHHCGYERGKEPWDYPSCFLRCLCEDCHLERAEIEYHALVTLSTFSGKEINEIMGAIGGFINRGGTVKELTEKLNGHLF